MSHLRGSCSPSGDICGSYLMYIYEQLLCDSNYLKAAGANSCDADKLSREQLSSRSLDGLASGPQLSHLFHPSSLRLFKPASGASFPIVVRGWVGLCDVGAWFRKKKEGREQLSSHSFLSC
ncbi:unnamed protein product [Polarella glacialis]|uniref:Uncharacterized protein n=1 Tax=Polarella glacialis TaxID=89957 RepID=A0A813DA77_POLGL|nr:unnamed protein product [Polarella glacialis]CAE8682283.1 unnamed protein product [Polarella glacialis]